MPIKDLSDTVRLPRLGKIHLGFRDPQRGFPVKTDYFVLPKDHPAYDALVKLFGEKPKELRILIPVEDDETWCSQYYRAYNMTKGLTCKGDGEKCMRMVDDKTKNIADAKSETVSLVELPCEGKSCPIYQADKCKETMNLRFLIPEAPGLGIWQIDTGSINSILNINSCEALIRNALKRITLVPLLLTFEPQQVNNPETGQKQTVYVMNLRTNITIAELAEESRRQTHKLLVAPLEDYDPADYWDNGESKKVTATVEPSTPEGAKPPVSSPIPPGVTEGKQQEAVKAESNAPEKFEGIGLDWLAESLKKLPRWKVGGWLHEHYPQAEGDRVKDIVRNMTVEQRKAFAKEVLDRLGMI